MIDKWSKGREGEREAGKQGAAGGGGEREGEIE